MRTANETPLTPVRHRARNSPPEHPATPANTPLFRTEVLAERQTQWMGTVLLTPRISHRVFTAFGVTVAAAILALLFFADFARKARINGWLMPQLGLVRIYAPSPAVISQLHVSEGALVQVGAPLVTLSTELQSEALGATREEVVRRLKRRRDSLMAERDLVREVNGQQLDDLAKRLTALLSEQDNLERERRLQSERVNLAAQSEQRQRQLRTQGIVPVQRVEQATEERIDQTLNLRQLERTWAALQGDRLALEGELRNLPLKFRAQLAEMDRQIATLEQELAETEARRQIVIPAPQDGTVTAVQAELGGTATPSVPLLSIVPRGSLLEAHLFSPSRAIGFVRPGQRVLIRYQAFPYQKFGHHEGVVTTVSRSAISPGELPPQLSGLNSVHGGGEPVYRITVRLLSQSVTAYGEAMPLQPGMQLDADVVIESRRLIEWVLDPLFTITGTWKG